MKKHRMFLITFILLALLLAGQSLITPIQAAPATFTDSGSTLVININDNPNGLCVINPTHGGRLSLIEAITRLNPWKNVT